MQDDSTTQFYVRWLGLFLGPLLCCLCLYFLPTEYTTSQAPSAAEQVGATAPSSIVEFSWAGRATLAVMLWMGVWWLTEPIHITATALLPIVVFPWIGAATIEQACESYASHLIYLYLGGFVLALSMEYWGLGKRVALLTLRIVGTSSSSMIGGFMLVTATLSAFVSNTATATMMLPIALSIIGLLKRQFAGQGEQAQAQLERFGVCLLLAIAYSASIGGVATIIGTPPNAFTVAFLRKAPYSIDFSFQGWLPIGVSFCVVFLPIAYVLLTRMLFPVREVAIAGGRQLIDSELSKLGKVSRGEWNTMAVFLLVVTLWLFRPLLGNISIGWQGSSYQPLKNLSDSGIAMLGAMLLFLFPTNIKRREFTMTWERAEKLPWGILVLFGGGLSLADAVERNGVAEYLGSHVGAFAGLPPIVLVLAVVASIVFLTELTSNAATTASLVPVLAALAPGLGIHPALLVIPATVAASCAFMLPVATPPNAIVFGSGIITVPQMARAGLALNLVSVLLVTVLTFVVVKPYLGI